MSKNKLGNAVLTIAVIGTLAGAAVVLQSCNNEYLSVSTHVERTITLPGEGCRVTLNDGRFFDLHNVKLFAAFFNDMYIFDCITKDVATRVVNKFAEYGISATVSKWEMFYYASISTKDVREVNSSGAVMQPGDTVSVERTITLPAEGCRITTNTGKTFDLYNVEYLLEHNGEHIFDCSTMENAEKVQAKFAGYGIQASVNNWLYSFWVSISAKDIRKVSRFLSN